MKKVISLVLAVLMVMSMAAVSVFAADGNLSDGVYEVPVSLWHAKKDEASMGNFAVNQTAKVTIDNGKVTVELKPAANIGLDLSAFGFDSSKVYVKASDGKGGYVDSVVNKDSRGNVVSVSVPLLGQQEYTPIELNAGIPQMGEQDARIKLDWSKAKRIGDVPKDNASSSKSSCKLLETLTGLFQK